MVTRTRTNSRLTTIAVALTGMLCVSSGCSKAEKEKEPVASVQVTPAEKGSIAQVVSAEAVIFPLQQATVAPKITSTIAEFKIQRGSPVKKGQLLAILENKDLAAQAQRANASIVCTSCHQEGFKGDSVQPRLAGQNHDYLAKTMTDFRTGARANNPSMTDLMKAISDSDIAALATYIAGLQL